VALCTDDIDTLVGGNNILTIFVETLVNILQYQQMFSMKECVIFLLFSLLLTKNMLLEICSPVNVWSISKEMKQHEN
jgi:hypothetical protein